MVAAKKNVRLLECGEWPAEPARRLEFKRVNGGLLVHDTDFALYRERNLVERFFNKLKQYRAISTRYDKLANTFLAAVALVCVLFWLN